MSPGTGVVQQLVTKLTFQVNTRQLNNFKGQITRLQRMMGSFSKGFLQFGTALGGVAGSLSAAVSSLIVFGRLTSESALNLKNAAENAGVAQDRYEALSLAAKNFGIGQEQFNSLMKSFADEVFQAQFGLGKLARAFQIIQEPLNPFLSIEDQLKRVAEVAASIKDIQSRNRFLGELFPGASASDLSRLFAGGAQGLTDAIEKNLRLVNQYTDQDFANLQRFRETYNEFIQRSNVLMNQISLIVVPHLNQLLGGINQYLDKNNQYIAQVGEYFKTALRIAEDLGVIVREITQFASRLFDSASKIPGLNFITGLPLNNISSITSDIAQRATNLNQPVSPVNLTVNNTIEVGGGVEDLTSGTTADNIFKQFGEGYLYYLDRWIRQTYFNNQQEAY